MTGVAGAGRPVGFSRKQSWPRALYFAFAISLCVCIDILQHSVPLPFLPMQLKAQGHTTMEVASVMGGYYWAGFCGGFLLTCVQVRRVIFDSFEEPTWAEMRSHIWKLIGGLSVGCLTLLLEFKNPDFIPDLQVHLFCRLAQGFIGAFLFFYSFLLAVKLFEGPQQVCALTMTSIALNVAEVFGPLLGAAVFTAYGEAAPYLMLILLSLGNNCFLFVVIVMLRSEDPGERQPLMSDERASEPFAAVLEPSSPNFRQDEEASVLPQTGLPAIKAIFMQPALWRAVMVICPAAAIKSMFESILPFFGTKHNYSELSIGLLFTIVACAYILTSVGIGYYWLVLSKTARNNVVCLAMAILACVAGSVLTSYRGNLDLQHVGLVDISKHELFYVFLALYGVALGLTHTPANFLLAEAVDAFTGASAQDAVNGIFNTCWELGGSLGFVFAGWASVHSTRQEQLVLGFGSLAVMVGMFGFIWVSETTQGAHSPEIVSLRLYDEKRRVARSPEIASKV